MTVDNLFKLVTNYIFIYLGFKVMLWLMPPGSSWQLTTLVIVTVALLTANLIYGLTRRIDNQPTYPSTVRARIKGGLTKGMKDGATKR